MPRLPVDGKKVQEFRVTLGTKERELLEDLTTSFRIQSFLESDVVQTMTKSPLHMIAFIESILTLIEFFGIETGFTTPVDAYDWLKNRFKDPGGEVGTWDAFWDVNFKQDFERFFGGRT